MNRRGLLAALVALPLAWKLAPAAAPAPLSQVLDVGNDVFMFNRGQRLVSKSGPGRGITMTIAEVNYQTGRLTVAGSRDGENWFPL